MEYPFPLHIWLPLISYKIELDMKWYTVTTPFPQNFTKATEAV